MKFDWTAGILFGLSLLLFGFSFTTYYKNKYILCGLYFTGGMLLFSASVIIYFWDSILDKETLVKDVATITRTEVKKYIEENEPIKQKETQQSEPLSLYYEAVDKNFFPEKPTKKPLDKSERKKIRIGGVHIEGERVNVIPTNWFNNQKSLQKKGLVKDSRVMLSPTPEYIFRLESHESLNIDIKAPAIGGRNDYIFSFLYYTDNKYFPLVKLQYSISDGNEKVTENFSYRRDDIHLIKRDKGLIVYRPSISHKFSSQPQKVQASIYVENTTTKDFTFILCYPMIEQGLFASSFIPPTTVRSGETVSWEGADKVFNRKKGTLSFSFQPYWGANDLTAGISPHLFYWVTDDFNDGIKIFADSNDHGKIKVESISDGSKSYIVSELSPIKGEAYSVYFRWDNNLADLIINGKNVYSAKLVMPSGKALSNKIYLGSSPISKKFSAFAVFARFSVYDEWLSDRIIKAEIFRTLPEQFPEFEGYARELIKAEKKKS